MALSAPAAPSRLDLGAPPPLAPRFRRLLTYGGILDETFVIFRRTWIRAVGMWTLSTVAGALAAGLTAAGMALVLGGSSLATLGDPARALSGSNPAATATFLGVLLVVGLAVGLVFAVCYAAAIAGITVLVDRALREQHVPFWRAYAAGIKRIPAVVVCGIVFALAISVLMSLSLPTFLLSGFGLLGTPLALLGLIAWAASPRARRRWTKWFIILATPFGLVLYFSVRWSLWIQAIVLERAGPIQALERSHALVGGNWFRVFGTWVVMAVISYVLQAIPGLVFGAAVLPLVASRESTSVTDAFGWVNLANTAGGWLGNLLFGSLTFVAFTLVYVDLRNRREGADLEERIARLEALAGAHV